MGTPPIPKWSLREETLASGDTTRHQNDHSERRPSRLGTPPGTKMIIERGDPRVGQIGLAVSSSPITILPDDLSLLDAPIQMWNFSEGAKRGPDVLLSPFKKVSGREQ